MGLFCTLSALGGWAWVGLRASSPLPLWGDGFAHDSIDVLWRPATWADVDIDELVIVNPALLRAPRVGGAARDLTAHLRACLSACDGDGWAGQSALLDSHRRRMAILLPSIVAPTAAAALIKAALAGDAAPKTEVGCPNTAFSLLTGVNAAYVFPEAIAHHETLAVAAWIGILAGGRDALLPALLAPRLLDLLTTDAVDPSDGMLLACLDRLAARSTLARKASRAFRLNAPVHIKSRL